MKRETYLFFHEYFLTHPKAAAFLRLYDRLIVAFAAAAYTFSVVMTGVFAFHKTGNLFGFFTDPYARMVIELPAIGFFFVTIIRKKMNRKRPFELYDFAPTLQKKAGGNGFPSRHVYSVFAVCVTQFYCYILSGHRAFFLILGIVLALLGADLAAVRVIGGVHFIKDVLAGALLAAAIGGGMLLIIV